MNQNAKVQTYDPSSRLLNLLSSLDIGDFEDCPTGKLVLKHPKTLAETTSFIMLTSPEHESRKRIQLARTRAVRQEYSNTGKMPVRDPLDDYEDDTEELMAATLGWEITQNGQSLEFSKEAARALYTNPKTQWVREQALAGMKKTELFITASPKA